MSRRSRVEGRERRTAVPPARGRCVRLLVLAAVLVLGGCAVINRVDGVQQARELRRTGVAASGEILRIWDTGITVNNDPVIGALVRVTPPEGEPFEASTKCLIGRLDVPRFQPGAEVPVSFDPSDHSRVSIEAYAY